MARAIRREGPMRSIRNWQRPRQTTGKIRSLRGFVHDALDCSRIEKSVNTNFCTSERKGSQNHISPASRSINCKSSQAAFFAAGVRSRYDGW